MGKSTINGPFSIATLNCQRVYNPATSLIDAKDQSNTPGSEGARYPHLCVQDWWVSAQGFFWQNIDHFHDFGVPYRSVNKHNITIYNN